MTYHELITCQSFWDGLVKPVSDLSLAALWMFSQALSFAGSFATTVRGSTTTCHEAAGATQCSAQHGPTLNTFSFSFYVQ